MLPLCLFPSPPQISGSEIVFPGELVFGAMRYSLPLISESDLGLGFSLNRFRGSGKKRIKLLINLHPDSIEMTDKQDSLPQHPQPCALRKAPITEIRSQD